MEFTTTESGNQKLIRDGYMYVFKKMMANDISSLECIREKVLNVKHQLNYPR